MAELSVVLVKQDRDAARMEAGAALRRERKRKGLSLREAARQLEVSAPYLSDVELGRRWLSPEHQSQYLTILQYAEQVRAISKAEHRPGEAINCPGKIR